MLGQLYYLGTRSIPRNYEEARYFFHQIIEKAASGSKTPEKSAKIVGQAAGYLGKMYWRGEGVLSNPEKAFKWFKMGAELNDANSQNGLGLMYLDGIVVPKVGSYYYIVVCTVIYNIIKSSRAVNALWNILTRLLIMTMQTPKLTLLLNTISTIPRSVLPLHFLQRRLKQRIFWLIGILHN
jgi:TPR repeat protein